MTAMCNKGRAAASRCGYCFVTLLAVVLVAGCPSDPYDPSTWIAKLEHPHEAAEALQKLQQLKDPRAIPELGAFWQDRRHPSKVLRIIISLARVVKDGHGPSWEPAVPFLIEALANLDVGDPASREDAQTAAEALGESGTAGVTSGAIVEALVTAATLKEPRNSPVQRVRIAAAKALGAHGTSDLAVDTLIGMLQGAVADQPIMVNAAAANGLAMTGDPRSVQPLLRCIYELPIYKQCRRGLAAVGGAVIPELIKVLKGKHAALKKFAKANDFANDCDKGEGHDTACKAPGILEFKAAELLGDLRAKQSVPQLVAKLGEAPKTSSFDPRSGAQGPPTHHGFLNALRLIGDKSAASAVRDYWKDTNQGLQTRAIAIDVYSQLADDDAELKALSDLFSDDKQDEGLRLSSCVAYGRLARRKSHLAPLVKTRDWFKTREDRHLKKAGKTRKPKEKKQQEQLARNYTPYRQAFDECIYRAQVHIECGSRVDCLLGYATAKDVSPGQPGLAKAVTATLAIRKLGAEKAVAPLLARADVTERQVRESILLTLPNIASLPCELCEQRLGEVVAEQQSQTTLDYLTDDTRIVQYFFRWAGK